MIRRVASRILRVMALLGTSYFLIATSAPPEPNPPNRSAQTCNHAAETRAYRVTGTCGPQGNITVMSPANECAIVAQGATAVGLPPAGRFDNVTGAASTSLTAGGWRLSGYMPESMGTGVVAQDDASVFAVVRDAGPDLAGPARADAGAFGVVSDAKPNTPDATGGQVTGPITHGKTVLRTCVYLQSSASLASLTCTEDGRSVCEAILQAQP